jgi:peptidoglycan hydrolase-like protein with peptidoglycan-binding domain
LFVSALRARFARRPLDSFAIVCAAVVMFAIITNAVFLQSGSQPAPFVVNPTSQTADARPKATEQIAVKPPDPTPTHSLAAPHLPQVAAVPLPPPSPRRNDPIADLIGGGGPSSRIVAVQRLLAQYGYGQIKPSGILDAPTAGAIEKFEREHKLPVSGRVSERLVSELTVMTGHPIE